MASVALSKAFENGLSGKSGDSVSGSLPAGKGIQKSESGNTNQQQTEHIP